MDINSTGPGRWLVVRQMPKDGWHLLAGDRARDVAPYVQPSSELIVQDAEQSAETSKHQMNERSQR